jgi:hypothetical protein
MPNTQIVPKKSVIAGAVPTSGQLALGGISINHADRRIFARHPSTGEIYKLAGAKDAPTKVEVFDIIGNHLFYGKLAYSDFPNSGSIYDSQLWDIARTTTDANGNVAAETSAIGQWSNKTNLQFS